MMTIRLLIVDDHSVVRQGLKMFLSTEKEIEITGEAQNGLEALSFIAANPVDVVLMDLMMPVMDGLEAIKRIKQDHPHVEVIALTSVLEDEVVIHAVQAGSCGYLLKNTDSEELITAIKAAASGEVYFVPEAAAMLIKNIYAPRSEISLSEREMDVLGLLARGYSNKEIANELVIALTTVKTHVSNLMQKMGAASRTQAALFAVHQGLVELTDLKTQG